MFIYQHYLKKINLLKVIQILFYIFVFLFLLKNSYGYLDPDLGWHLKVGEQILQEKQLPNLNYYNYTLNKQNWVDHEWLSNLSIFYLYQNFDYLPVNLLFVLIVLTILIILNIFTRKYFVKNNKGVFFVIIFQILGLFAMAPHLGVRMQEITLLNLLLLIIIIYLYEKKKATNILFWLLPLFYFWACAHAGFLIGLFILFFWILIKLIELWLANRYKKLLLFIDFNKTLPLKQIKIFLLFSILSCLATIITPYQLKLYSFLSSYKNTFYLTHINEWLSQYHFPFAYWQLTYLAIVSAVLILLFYNAIKAPRKNIKINLWQTFISLLFIALSFKSRRHFPLLFIVSFPLLINFFTDFFYLSNNALLKSSIVKKVIVCYLIICILILNFLQIIKTNFATNPFNSFCNHYPCKAVEFLKQNSQYYDFNIFNNYGWGGYLIWVWPEKKLFIDGRLPQCEFAGHTMLEEYYAFFQKEKAKEKLNQYNIRLVLLKINKKQYKINWLEKFFFRIDEKKINNQKNYYLKQYLDNAQNWKLVYNDNISNVYIKK